MAKCSRCGQRKAKRHCPALGILLCPQCCAQDRLSSIDCPLDCEHLAGERYQHLRRRERAETLGQAFVLSLATRFRNEASFGIAFQLSSDIYWWTLEKGSETDAMIARAVLDAADRESPLHIESSTSTPLGRYLSHLIAHVEKYQRVEGAAVTRAERRELLVRYADWVRETAGGAGNGDSHKIVELLSTYFGALDFEADLDYSPREYLEEWDDDPDDGSGFERKGPGGLFLPTK